MDIHGVKCTLRVYAKQLLRVHRQEVIVFRKHTSRGAEGSDIESGANMNTASTQEGLPKPPAPFRKYEKLVMGMFLP